MSDEFTLDVEGMKEITNLINGLSKCVESGKVEDAFLAGAMNLQQAAKAAAPVGPTGNLKKDIKVKQLPKLGNNPKAAIVKSTAPHDHLIEFGTKPRYTKSGKFTGIMPAHPFFRPAIDANKQAVLTQVADDIMNSIDEAVK
jgi:HK97 gp10 family phage protein